MPERKSVFGYVNWHAQMNLLKSCPMAMKLTLSRGEVMSQADKNRDFVLPGRC